MPSSVSAEICTVPSSSMSIFAPVSSWMRRIILPPGPMTAPIFSGLILIDWMRGAYGERLSRGSWQRLEHLIHDEHAALFGLRHRLRQDLHRQALDLDVHLQRRDAIRRARDLEVHVAHRVLDALDVGEDRVAVGGLAALGDQAHRHAGDRRLDRHASVHQREGAAAGRTHRGRAVRAEHLGDDADRVGELVLARGSPAPARARPARHARSRAVLGHARSVSRRR